MSTINGRLNRLERCTPAGCATCRDRRAYVVEYPGEAPLNTDPQGDLWTCEVCGRQPIAIRIVYDDVPLGQTPLVDDEP